MYVDGRPPSQHFQEVDSCWRQSNIVVLVKHCGALRLPFTSALQSALHSVVRFMSIVVQCVSVWSIHSGTSHLEWCCIAINTMWCRLLCVHSSATNTVRSCLHPQWHYLPKAMQPGFVQHRITNLSHPWWCY